MDLRTNVILVVALAAAVVTTGCGQQAADSGPAVETAPVDPPSAVAEPSTLEVVSVSGDGTEFDPPVQVAQIPDGAWYCDMGTVHYAQMTERDRTCGVCGMNLTHKVAAGGADDVDAHDEGETHDEAAAATG